jgi:hypothetical protein
MLPRDRIAAAFAKQPCDRIPVHHIGFSSQVASLAIGREAYVGGGIQQWREARALWNGPDAHAEFLERSLQDAFDLGVVLGHDLMRMQYWRMPVRPAQRLDERSFLYGDPDGEWQVRTFDPETEMYQVSRCSPSPEGAVDYPRLEADLKRQEKALAGDAPAADGLADERHILERFGARHALRLVGDGICVPYEPALWLEATVVRPDLVARLLDVQAERIARRAPALAEAGVYMIFGGGDMASNDGPFYSPRVFEELVAPRLKRATDACHAHGVRYLFASDGNLWPVADVLFGQCGVDGYFEVDGRAGMDLGRLRDAYPGLTLLGNISSQTVHRGTPQDVAAEALGCIEAAKRYNGIIVGLSNYAMPGTPPENLQAMIETIAQNR